MLLVLGVGSTALAVESQWVQRGISGRLIYVPDAEGDRVPDFSGVGYRGGTAPIPDVPVVAMVQPVPGDDTSTIQAAINQVAAMPLGTDGFRGAVLLEAGDYQIGGQLTIGASGVVLRGVGRGVDGTVLHATGTSQRDLIQVLGSGSQSLTGSTRNMIDKVVPVGARSFRVDSTAGFAVGDTVRVTRPSTADWISDIGMDSIPPRDDGGTVIQWEAGSFDLRFDRVITRIEGDRIFVDAPLANSFELQYGGGQIKRYDWSDRIENVGIENLRAESEFASDTDEAHSWNFVSIDKAQHVWVRDTTSAYFARSAVLSNPQAKWITVENAINLDPKSEITGSRRYTFDLSGQLELVTDSEANEGRHDFVNNSTRPAGPHVFHNSIANNAVDESGPHQRWATGTLFDNITVDGDQINARNRGNFGTGHGWAGANMVIWNSTAESFIVQNPPTAQNWLIGSTGTVIDDETFGPQPPGYVDAHGTLVEIESLYEAQVADAANVTTFHWSGADDNWSNPEAWHEQLAPGGYRVELRDYLIGDIDDFVADGPASVDNAFVDPAWESYIQGTSADPITGFDDVSAGNNVAFTIQHQLEAGERVIHGSLALALLQAGGSVGSDFVRLFDDDGDHTLTFSELGWDTAINGTDAFVGVIDLGPFTGELQNGAVNVQVSNDTAVDWAIYTITVAQPLSAPLGAVVFVDGGGRALVDSAVGGVSELSVGGSSASTLAISSTGEISVADQYTQAANGTLQVELAGPGDFGTLAVAGDAVLDGILEVTLEGVFEPLLGQMFAPISASGLLSGVFADAQLPVLATGLAWKVNYVGGTVALEVVLAGDYNDDGVVDAADYTLWRDTLGSITNLVADGNNNRLVDPGDFEIWNANFGHAAADFAAGASALRTAVPEPTAFAMVSLIIAAASSTRFRTTTTRSVLR